MHPNTRHTHNYILSAVALPLLDAQWPGQSVLYKQAQEALSVHMLCQGSPETPAS